LNRKLLIAKLSSADSQERIEAARLLKGNVVEYDRDSLYELYSKESSPWVKNEIKCLLDELSVDKNKIKSPPVVESNEIDLEAVRRDARADVIGKILHELNPLVGGIGLLSRELASNFEGSDLSVELDLLDRLLTTFEDWQRVDQPLRVEQVDISALLLHLVETYRRTNPEVTFDLILDDSIVYETDRSLFNIILRNVIRNGVESILRKGRSFDGRVIICCGVNGRALWGSIVDNGVGLPPGKEFYRHEFTTKPGHQGRGLTTVNQAVSSLRGSWDLEADVAGGAKFNFQLNMA